MSDDRRDNEDKDFEESEPTGGKPGDERKKESTSDAEGETTPEGEAAPEGEAVPEGEDGADESLSDSEDSKEKQEAFDDYFDDDADPYGQDDYYYDEHGDYGFEEPKKGPRKPKSAAGRMLSRQRAKDALREKSEDEDEESEDEEGGMSFLEHLEEFRWTIARSVLAFIIGVIVVVIFHKDIAQWIQLPLHKAYGSADLARDNLITYKAMGVISVFFQIALLGGLTLSMPFMLYFLGSFVAPGLTEKERRVLRPACYTAFLLFLIGVAFAFFIILPLALGFTVRLNQHLGFDILWAASDYYNMVVWFSLSIGIFFQFPLVVVILVYIGVLATETLRRARKMVFVGLMIFSALVSPGGDPVSLAVTTGFMYGLYELAILTGARIERKKQEQQEAEV